MDNGGTIVVYALQLSCQCSSVSGWESKWMMNDEWVKKKKNIIKAQGCILSPLINKWKQNNYAKSLFHLIFYKLASVCFYLAICQSVFPSIH